MTAGFGRGSRALVIGSALLLAVVVSACLNGSTAPAPSQSGATSAGVLVPKSTTLDLGKVPFDVQAEGRFDLVNSGSQPVKLVGAPQVKMLEGC